MIFEVDGIEYRMDVEVMREDDNSKNWHDVTNVATGETTFLDWSPYSNPTVEELQLWVKLGMPDRFDFGLCGPIDGSDLLRHAEEMK